MMGVVPILYAIICLHHMCTEMLVPTDNSLTANGCAIIGPALAQQYVPKPWRFVVAYCLEGRNV